MGKRSWLDYFRPESDGGAYMQAVLKLLQQAADIGEHSTGPEAELFLKLVDEMPIEQREVYDMHRSGMSYKEIGRTLGLPDKTVLQRLGKAYAGLRDGLRAAGYK